MKKEILDKFMLCLFTMVICDEIFIKEDTIIPPLVKRKVVEIIESQKEIVMIQLKDEIKNLDEVLKSYFDFFNKLIEDESKKKIIYMGAHTMFLETVDVVLGIKSISSLYEIIY